MIKYLRYILLLSTLLVHYSFFAQTKSYSVSIAPFSSLTNDEFSPVYYKNGVVFCSNLKNNSLITYQDEKDKLFNIFFVAVKDSLKWSHAKILAKELTTNYNEGPAAFNETGNIIYYSRNNDIREQIKNVVDTTNKLGIYSAELIEGKWTNIQAFEYNNPLYFFVTPALTHDGRKLYFASDMPGGYGGIDLYYCDWNENTWSQPKNMGPAVNTQKNESFPFACKSGKLFFASDGHEGFGGKDLYYSQQIEGEWITPIHLDADINSSYDDFGIVTDMDFENGYFSSNRRNTDDIFRFTPDPVQFSGCDSMQKNDYCFMFYDENHNDNDTIPVIYEWSFGSGVKKTGFKVMHCFPGPGNYEVTLSIIDSMQIDSILGITHYKFELEEINQVFINSPDVAITGDTIQFDGLKTNLPGFEVSDYLWNLGEGFITRGPAMSKAFTEKGEYTIQLGLLGEKDSLGNFRKSCAYKEIKVFDDYQELATQTAKEISDYDGIYTPKSNLKSGFENNKLINLQENSGEVTKSNFLMVKIYLLDNMSELQRYSIYKNLYDIKGNKIEINEEGIDSASYLTLIRFIRVLKENPKLKLEIAVHTDNSGSSGDNHEKTERWARNIYSYFLENGVTSDALHCKAYGESRPIVDEDENNESYLNKRVEFIFRNSPK